MDDEGATVTKKRPTADEIWTALYGSPDGTWFLLRGKLGGPICPPLIGTSPYLGSPQDVVQTVYNQRYYRLEAERAVTQKQRRQARREAREAGTPPPALPPLPDGRIQQELADLIQVGQQSVSRYLRGTSLPDLPSAGWANLVREYWKEQQ